MDKFDPTTKPNTKNLEMMPEPEGRIKSYIQGPKFLGPMETLWNLADKHNLKLTVTQQDKGWFATTIYFEVHGKLSDLEAFRYDLESIT